ncbi:hypothetical protein Tco_0194979 [Tanacetum coccineum]
MWWWRGFGGGDGGVIRRVKESDGGDRIDPVTRSLFGLRRKMPAGKPVDPPSPDYVPGPEHPSSPDYVPIDASPAALSSGYVPDSDLEEDPEEDSEEHADYPADGGDGDDEPSDDDSDDDTNDDDEEPFEHEEDDEEEEEHPASADSSAIPVVDPVPSTRLRRARKTVRPEPPMSASMEARIAEYAATPTPPLPIASSPLPLPSPLTTSPTDAGAPLGYRAAGIRMRAAAASPPLSLPSTSHRTDVPEAEMPPQKRACLTTPAPGCEIGESSAAGAARQPGPTPEVSPVQPIPPTLEPPTRGHRADYGFIGTMDAEIRRQRAEEVGYGIKDVWVDSTEAVEEVAPTALEGVNARVTKLAAVQE